MRKLFLIIAVLSALLLMETDMTTLGDALNARAPIMSRTTVSDANYTALATDVEIVYTSLTAARTVTFTPRGTATLPKLWIVKDESGQAGAHPISFASTSGTFDGLTGTGISSAYGSKTFVDNGTNFFMYGTFLPSVNASSKIQKADGNGGFVDAVAGTDYATPASIPSVLRATSTLSLALVGTGATGTQISSTKDCTVKLSLSTSTTSNIGGPSTSVIALKICATNNATEASWTTVATLENDQTISLALALNSVQVMKAQLQTDVPAAWYVKLVNSGTGTHAESVLAGQQTIYG